MNLILHRVDSLICTPKKWHSHNGCWSQYMRPGKLIRPNFLRSARLLYKILPTSLGTCKPTFHTFYTSHLRWNSTMRRCLYHTDLGQNAVFHYFAILIIYTKKLLNSDWLRKECSSSVTRVQTGVTRVQTCNMSGNYKRFLIGWKHQRKDQEPIRLELF